MKKLLNFRFEIIIACLMSGLAGTCIYVTINYVNVIQMWIVVLISLIAIPVSYYATKTIRKFLKEELFTK